MSCDQIPALCKSSKSSHYFPLPFPPLKPSHRTLLVLFRIHGLVFINSCYMYVYIYVPKCNLLSLYNVSSSVHVCRANHLVLDNQLVFSSLETISPTLCSLVACSSLYRSEAMWSFPCPLWHVCSCSAQV